MNGTVTHADGTTAPATVEDVKGRCQETEFFWLDLDGLDTEATDLLLHGFGFHPLAIEDAEHFGQRPKLDAYDGFTYLVVHGAQAEDPSGTIEVHLFYSPGRLVTVHHGQCVLMDEARSPVRTAPHR